MDIIGTANFFDIYDIQKCWNANLPILCNKLDIMTIMIMPKYKTFIHRNNNIIGFGICEYDDDFFHLCFFAIDTKYRKNGYGKKMMLFIENYAKDNKLKLSLNVHVTNKGAVIFYKKMGFKIIKTLDNYYNGQFEGSNDAFRMEKIDLL
jgi:ribosomal protein S18 acetylase RimI-like enzyme